MIRRPLPAVLVLAVGLSYAAPAGAQGAEDLHSVAERVAVSWNESSVERLEELLMPRGVGVHAAGGGREILDPRKAVAALEQLFARLRTRSARVVRVQQPGGAGDRGSAEIAWEAVAPGTSEVLRHTVFVGFSREEGPWRIYEIRVLP